MNIALRLLYVITALAPLPAQSFTLEQQGVIGWSVKDLHVNVNYTNCPQAANDLERDIDRAFEIWNAVSTSNIRLIRGNQTTTDAATANSLAAVDAPLIVCDTALSAHITRSANLIPAWTRITNSSGTINYAAILLNAETGMTANIANLTHEQITIMLAHEAGHLLGLGHSDDQSSLMHYNYGAKTHLRLSQDDIDGLTYLYARVEPDEDKVFGCATSSSGAAPGGPLGPVLLFAFALLTALVLRLRLVSIRGT